MAILCQTFVNVVNPRTLRFFNTPVIKWHCHLNPISTKPYTSRYILSYFSTIKTLSWLSRCSTSMTINRSYFSQTLWTSHSVSRPKVQVSSEGILSNGAYFPFTTRSVLRHMSASPENPSKSKNGQVSPKDDTATTGSEDLQEMQKLGLFKRYKKMLKEYWYVLLPVHFVTSLVWFGSFYYMAQCGIDIVPVLIKLGFSESFTAPLKNSGVGHLAVAAAMYKIATPARYFVTLGATTFTIRYLTKRGLLKPMPSKDQLKAMLTRQPKTTLSADEKTKL